MRQRKHKTRLRSAVLVLLCILTMLTVSASAENGDSEEPEIFPEETLYAERADSAEELPDDETSEEPGAFGDASEMPPEEDGAAEATPMPSPIAEPDPFAAAQVLRYTAGLLAERPGIPAWAMTENEPGVYTAAALLRNMTARPDDPAEETPQSTAAPDPVLPKNAEELLASMTLREKVWQLIIVRPSDLDAGCVTEATGGAQEALGTCPVGGVIFFAENMKSKDQVRSLLSGLQSASGIPLLMMCDEEGGTVSRLMRTVGTTWIGPMLSYRDMGTETAFQNAQTIGSDMSALGFNMDLAPVADVRSNPSNTAIGTRAYSDSFSQAAELIPAAVRGFHSGGVACTLKHFPGHGDTTADTHDGTVYVYKTLDELREGELLPFQAGIDAGADAVMIGHLTVPDIYDEPALFSHAVVTELLRGEMGFEGVILSDALEMKALSDHYTDAQIAVRAVKAGADMLLLPVDPQAAADALAAAVESGEIPESRLDESVLRVLKLKEDRGLF